MPASSSLFAGSPPTSPDKAAAAASNIGSATTSNSNNTSRDALNPPAAPLTPSKSSGSSPFTSGRPESPLLAAARQRVTSPSSSPYPNSRIPTSSSSTTAGRPSSPSTPQRPVSRTSLRGTPTSSGNPEAALTSLQELIRTMPAPSELGGSSNNGSPSKSPAPPPPSTIPANNARPRSTSSGASSTTSTLNPNAGGFQPGALSSLGEVDNEHLITPMASHFDLNTGNPFGGNANNNHSSPANVFGSPISTPQHQVGASHQNFLANATATDWQNYHNVFNAGIGNSAQNSPANARGGGNNDPTAILAAAAAAGLTGGDGSNNNNPLAAAAAAMGMNPLQAQLAMLQIQAQQQALFGSPGSFAQQQPHLFQQQQQQQLQLQQLQQAMLAAQLAGQSPGGGGGGSGNVGPRFAQSSSQPDLASLLVAQQQQNAGVNNAADGGNNGGNFAAEQMALSAQYEALRQQQADLMQRFSEMQFQAQQLAQAQIQVQAMSSPQSQPSSIGGGGGNAGSPAHQASQQNANAATAGRGPHRRGPSASVSSIAGQASSGPMGQFGSMGQFSLPSQASTAPGNPAASALPKGHGRRHSVNVKQRDPNLNTAFSFPAGGNNPTQQIGGGNDLSNAMQAVNLQNQQMDNGEQQQQQQQGHPGQENVHAGRMYGHGRRESRGSIGSLAGWGSNSNIVTQSSVPIGNTNVTDLAQAQAQLQQLSQFRASAGHSRIPSFGVQQLGTPQGSNAQQQQRKSLFAPYLPAASIPPLLQTGKLVIGTLRVNKRNRSDAYVATDVLDADVFICGSKDRNRALEGDVVAVELLDVDEVWGTKKEKEEKKRKKEEAGALDPRFQQHLRRQDKKKDDVEVEGQGLTLFEDEEVNDDQKPAYAGHVVAVVERQAGQLFAGTLGILRPSSAATKEKQDAERRERDGIDVRGNDERAFRPKIIWFKPVDKRVPLVAIPADQAPEGFLDSPEPYNSTLFVACIKRWPITSLHPFGSLVEELGEIGNIEAETNALLKDSGFTDEIFSENVAKCLPPVPWTIPATEIEARKDFRQCRVFTIDPETARDLDDALHINKLDDGTFEVGVHIADVSHFVKPNTALDREARRRATTVYLVQRASPMLPPTLCESLCSLRPGEERLAFSAVFKMSKEGRVLSTWFGKSVIKSAAKLAYSHAQMCINGEKLPESVQVYDDHDPEGIAEDIKQLDDMARQMRARRFDNGALRIDNVKLSFKLDAEGRPDDCTVYERQDSHSLIEEFMLLANQAAAQKIASALPEQAFLRRHEAPIARRLEGFEKRAQRLGFEMDTSSAGNLMSSFNKLGKEDPELILRVLATKSMLQAKYICSGLFDIAQYHHYALNVPIYTHFTSPIRRYADVIVHRQLEAALTDNPEGRFVMDSEAVSKVAQHCNTKKAAAKLAQEASQHLFLCTLISDLTQKYGPVRRQASVIGVLDQAFDVVVSDFGIEKRVHADQMPIENHVHDERSNTLQLYWKKGVDVIKFLADNSGDPHLQRIRETAEQHARLMEASSRSNDAEKALFEDDEEAAEEGQVIETANATSSGQKQKSMNKKAPVFESVEQTAAGHCVQTIKELQTIPVIVSADLTVCPPVIKVFAVNPFA